VEQLDLGPGNDGHLHDPEHENEKQRKHEGELDDRRTSL
jgi:hypothetical protein